MTYEDAKLYAFTAMDTLACPYCRRPVVTLRHDDCRCSSGCGTFVYAGFGQWLFVRDSLRKRMLPYSVYLYGENDPVIHSH